MFNKILFLHFFLIYVLVNNFINNTYNTYNTYNIYNDETNINYHIDNIQIPLRRLFIDTNNNIYVM